MGDEEPFYSPTRKPPPRRTTRTPGEPLWEFRKDDVTWSAELKFHGESHGWEALILRAGELSISRRFLLRSHAVAWADGERADIEKGWRARSVGAVARSHRRIETRGRVQHRPPPALTAGHGTVARAMIDLFATPDAAPSPE